MNQKRFGANSDLAEKRLDICKKCPESRTVLGQMQCKVCHCYLNVKVKLAFSKCPIGKW